MGKGMGNVKPLTILAGVEVSKYSISVDEDYDHSNMVTRKCVTILFDDGHRMEKRFAVKDQDMMSGHDPVASWLGGFIQGVDAACNLRVERYIQDERDAEIPF